MKETIKLFNRITRNIINVDNFYAITIYKNEIRLQGNMNSDAVMKYGKYNLLPNTGSGFLEAKRMVFGIKICIILT